MHRRVLLSPMILAVALSPALLTAHSCERGNTDLSVLELVDLSAGGNLIQGFDPNVKSYAVLPSGAQVFLNAVADEPTSRVGYQWTIAGTTGSIIDLGVGGGTATLDVPPGDSMLHLTVRAEENNIDEYTIDVAGPSVAPALTSSEPVSGASISRATWLKVSFASRVPTYALGLFTMACDSASHPIDVHRIEPQGNVLAVNPVGQLPASASCELTWQGPSGPESLPFSTETAGSTETVLYDRSDQGRYAPFPDDIWLVQDATTPTGSRVELPTIQRFGVDPVFFALKRAAEDVGVLDGFSPFGGIVIELSAAPDPTSLPRDPAESLDPFSSIALFDLTPGSATYGQRVPFAIYLRSARRFNAPTDPLQHAAILFPSVALTPRGRYGLIVTSQAYADPTRPFEPAPFMADVLGDPEAGEAPEVAAARPLAMEVLDAVAAHADLPIPVDDVALALRFSIRSTDWFPAIPLKMKQDVLDAPAPQPRVIQVQPGFGPWAAFVNAEWDAPDWRIGADLALNQDGLPIALTTRPVEFFIAVPNAAIDAPVPLTMYQHGSGSFADAQIPGNFYLGEAGFAELGFTDNLHREVSVVRSEQDVAALTHLLLTGRVPDYWIETTGEQLSFVRMMSQLCNDGCDFVPYGAPDGQPDFDLTKPFTYVGVSEGANKGQALMPYAPEIAAGALVTGGLRGGEIFFTQDVVGSGGVGTSFLNAVNDFYSEVMPMDLWVGFSVFQLAFDYQDPQTHAAFMYANPIEVAGTTQKPSVLIQEGLADTVIPSNCSRGIAQTMGLVPLIEPVREAVPYLPTATPPVTGNFLGGTATAGLIQYVPLGGLPGTPPDAGCEFEPDGHFCGQIAFASEQLRVQFFGMAADGMVPTIVVP